MNKFSIAEQTEHFSPEEKAFAATVYRTLASVPESRDDNSMGICWNAQQLAEPLRTETTTLPFSCMYGLTGRLFDSINKLERAYPLNIGPLSDGWKCRERWCLAFAEALETGTLSVSDKLLATMHTTSYE